MDRRTFQRLFDKMQGNQASRQEVRSLMDAMESDPSLSRLFKELVAAEFEHSEKVPSGRNRIDQENQDLTTRLQAQWEMILERTHENEPNDTASPDPIHPTPVRSVKKWPFYRVAAVLLLLIGLGWGLSHYFQKPNAVVTRQVQQKTTEPVALTPGTDAAILTLDNGDKVALDSTTGSTIKQQDKLLARNANGQLDYQVARGKQVSVHYNTLTTKKGNQYKLVLPDGSSVWLNAESSIRFPTVFSGGSRDVVLTGEAYFEVLHDSRKPFKVHVRGQVIEDLGTSFNINAYENESALKATLVEGVIRIQNRLMRPGEQAVIDQKGHLEIHPHADIAQVTGWKQGMFIFHQMDMKEILRQVARWYNVDIVYEGVFNQTFTGGISRRANAEEILKILSYSDKVKFSIKGRKITVQQRHK